MAALFILILISTIPALYGQSSESTCPCRSGMRKAGRAAGSEVTPKALSGLHHQPWTLSLPLGTVFKLSPLQREQGWCPDSFWGCQAVPRSWVKVMSGVPKMENSERSFRRSQRSNRRNENKHEQRKESKAAE